MKNVDIEENIVKRIKGYKREIEEIRGKIILENAKLDNIRKWTHLII